MTNREFVSQVRSSHRLLGDAMINDRSILSVGRTNAWVLINQKANQRKGWSTDTLFTVLDCLEMEEVSLAACCDYASDRTISRSKLRIPSIAESNYQYMIQGVYDVDTSQVLKYMPLNRWINSQSLGLMGKQVYYLIHNGHLIVTSPDVKVVKLVALFTEDIPYTLLYPECDCGASRAKKIPCSSRLDEDFKCPSSIIGTVIDMTSAKLLNTYFNIPGDKTSDNKDDQTRNPV